MAPSITIGAVILLWRKAATKVIVSHVPRDGADHHVIKRVAEFAKGARQSDDITCAAVVWNER
jgi:hypothetical protein